LNKVLLKESLS
jgi:hypothetical protein